MSNPIVKIAIMVFAGIAIVVLQVAVSRMLVKKMFFTPKAEKPVQEEKEHHQGIGDIYTLEDLVINPAQSGGRRHLLVSIGLEYHHEGEGEESGSHSGGGEGELTGVGAELQSLEPVLRDNLITLLAGQNINILSDIKYRERIRKSLLEAINFYLYEGQVDRLYFTKYVFQ